MSKVLGGAIVGAGLQVASTEAARCLPALLHSGGPLLSSTLGALAAAAGVLPQRRPLQQPDVHAQGVCQSGRGECGEEGAGSIQRGRLD